jgi:hypothetical protein
VILLLNLGLKMMNKTYGHNDIKTLLDREDVEVIEKNIKEDSSNDFNFRMNHKYKIRLNGVIFIGEGRTNRNGENLSIKFMEEKKFNKEKKMFLAMMEREVEGLI